MDARTSASESGAAPGEYLVLTKGLMAAVAAKGMVAGLKGSLGSGHRSTGHPAGFHGIRLCGRFSGCFTCDSNGLPHRRSWPYPARC
jgi:hypothetical protein